MMPEIHATNFMLLQNHQFSILDGNENVQKHLLLMVNSVVVVIESTKTQTGKKCHSPNDARKQHLKSHTVTKSSIFNIRRQLTCVQTSILILNSVVVVVESTNNAIRQKMNHNEA